MAGRNTVTVRIVGDASSYEKSTTVAVNATEGMGKKIAAVAGGLGLAKVGSELVGFGKDSVEAFKESEKSAQALGFAFEQFPKLADSSAAAMGKLDDALAKKTRFDDDALKAGQATLAQFGLTGTQIEQLTPLLADYAAKTGKDIPEAADALGKAMLGKGKALGEIGIAFKDTKSLAGNFEQVMGGLRRQVGGYAEKEGKTAAGQAEILRNQFGELQEQVGAKLLPALSKLTSIGLGVVTWLQNLSPETQKMVGIGAALVGVVFGIIKATQAWTAVQAALNIVMDANPIVLIGIALAALAVGLVYAYQHSETFRGIVQGAFEAVKTAGAALWGALKVAFDGIVTAFHAVADAGVWLWDNALSPAWEAIKLGIAIAAALIAIALSPIIEGFQTVASVATWMWQNAIKPQLEDFAAVARWLWGNVLQPVFGAIGGAFKQVGADMKWVWSNVIRPVFDAINSAAQHVSDFLGTVFGAIGGVLKGPLNGVIWLVNKVIDAINTLSITVPDIPGLPHRGEKIGLDLPHIPQLAAGGIAMRPTLAVVGDDGPEAIIPLGRGASAGTGGPTINVYVTGALDSADAGQKVARALEPYLGRGGTITDGRGGKVQVA